MKNIWSDWITNKSVLMIVKFGCIRHYFFKFIFELSYGHLIRSCLFIKDMNKDSENYAWFISNLCWWLYFKSYCLARIDYLVISKIIFSGKQYSGLSKISRFMLRWNDTRFTNVNWVMLNSAICFSSSNAQSKLAIKYVQVRDAHSITEV